VQIISTMVIRLSLSGNLVSCHHANEVIMITTTAEDAEYNSQVNPLQLAP
jgi:hypothetical protein